MSSMPPRWCCRAARGAGHQLDARRRSPRCPRRAASRIRASIAAFASSAAPPTPSRARWSPGFRGRSPPAPKSAIWRWSAASRHDGAGRVTGVHYHREGRWRFQKARNVVVAGYAIETPRLLLTSANAQVSRRSRQQLRSGRQEPDGAIEPSGVGHDGAGDPLVQGPAVARLTEHWNYADKGKDFFGGYS